jgi:hypothetical protein
MVEDIERVIDEVYNVRVKNEQSEKKVLGDTFKLQKSVNDLEAHINTSIITEKAIRKSADKNLAEEVDSIRQLLNNQNRR